MSLCLWWKPRKPGHRKGCCKKKGWCLLCSAVLPTTAREMYSLYMSYESTVSLCQAISITTALWSSLNALSSTTAPFAGSKESPIVGAGVPVTCHAGAQGCGRLATNMGATGDISLSKGASILQSWQQWSLPSAGISRRKGKYTQSANHPSAKS